MEFTQLWDKLNKRFPERLTLATESGDKQIQVKVDDLIAVVDYIKNDSALAFNFLRLISAVDTGKEFSCVYHFYSYQHAHGLILTVSLNRANPTLPSLSSRYATADWLERECYDMMGFNFLEHPELRRILLPHDWDGYPLRKDYQQPAEYHGTKH
ncbi:MAG: NADH-quinone oxidoreductase subunit C [Deltaproteobacteria bacterium]|nr:NADH-quinone oxidoreductase subunit C [Deltaproteobacteria bacterium]